MLCKNGGIIGVVTNGGFAEYISVPAPVFKIPDEMDWDLAAYLSISILTDFHALKVKSKCHGLRLIECSLKIKTETRA
jgi:D-arabinose 1-dehydrogenase-like Zn-dependent alcohol dehydrogenase